MMSKEAYENAFEITKAGFQETFSKKNSEAAAASANGPKDNDVKNEEQKKERDAAGKEIEEKSLEWMDNYFAVLKERIFEFLSTLQQEIGELYGEDGGILAAAFGINKEGEEEEGGLEESVYGSLVMSDELKDKIDESLREARESMMELNAMDAQLIAQNDKVTESSDKRLDRESSNNKSASSIDSKTKDEKLKNLKAVGSALTEASDLFGKETVAGKAIAVAGALINTYLAGTQVMASEHGGMVAKMIAFATVLASGLAAVTSIVTTRVPGQSDSGGSATTAAMNSTPAATSMIDAPIQETHSTLTASEEEIMNQPQRVYVLESDISETMSKVSVAQSEASF